MIIKRADVTDTNDLFDLEKKSFSDDDWRLTKRVFRYHLKLDHFLVKAVEDGAIIGYALLLTREHSARLYAICVDPLHKRRGIGAALLEKTIAQAKQLNKRRLYLEAREKNFPAIALYKKFGFVKFGRLKGYYPRGQDGIKMILELKK
ncbi:MAG: ribosomal protein S18-alanine N-acetyltransferase [Helicobacteraceae bacterium]|jgi:ribosomal-protein-alanine N-acetyltransferase|nr:ribosomal protein S18-alanine N-acetyltransferase [Helicobacteraceae bacterium]